MIDKEKSSVFRTFYSVNKVDRLSISYPLLVIVLKDNNKSFKEK